jgi:hypothetical protein
MNSAARVLHSQRCASTCTSASWIPPGNRSAAGRAVS